MLNQEFLQLNDLSNRQLGSCWCNSYWGAILNINGKMLHDDFFTSDVWVGSCNPPPLKWLILYQIVIFMSWVPKNQIKEFLKIDQIICFSKTMYSTGHSQRNMLKTLTNSYEQIRRFRKFNLSKLTLFFQIFHVILKAIKQLTDFSKFWTLKKKNTCHFL